MIGTRYPLGVPMETGRETITRLGLTTESKIGQSIEDMRALSDLMSSAHAPTQKDDLRLNVGATDAEFREESIAEMLQFVETVRRFPRVKKVNMHPGAKQRLDPGQTRGRYGEYGLQIDGIRRVADYAAASGLELVIENTNAYFGRRPRRSRGGRDRLVGKEPDLRRVAEGVDPDRPGCRSAERGALPGLQPHLHLRSHLRGPRAAQRGRHGFRVEAGADQARTLERQLPLRHAWPQTTHTPCWAGGLFRWICTALSSRSTQPS